MSILIGIIDKRSLSHRLSLLSYYRKLLPKLSSILAPLYYLLKASVKWQWSHREQTTFDKSKELLLSLQILVHFDPDKEVILACDASPYDRGQSSRTGGPMVLKGL